MKPRMREEERESGWRTNENFLPYHDFPFQPARHLETPFRASPKSRSMNSRARERGARCAGNDVNIFFSVLNILIFGFYITLTTTLVAPAKNFISSFSIINFAAWSVSHLFRVDGEDNCLGNERSSPWECNSFQPTEMLICLMTFPTRYDDELIVEMCIWDIQCFFCGESRDKATRFLFDKHKKFWAKIFLLLCDRNTISLRIHTAAWGLSREEFHQIRGRLLALILIIAMRNIRKIHQNAMWRKQEMYNNIIIIVIIIILQLEESTH